MKTLIFTLPIFILMNVYSQSWVIQSSGTTANINDIFFLNANTGYAACNGGTILKTTDGGNNWLSISGPYTYNLTSIRFFDQNTGLVAGSGFSDSVLKSTNGGLNWIKVFNNGLSHFTIADNNTLYATQAFRVFKTTNRGDNWTQTGNIPPFTTTALFFINALTGWVTTIQPTPTPPFPQHTWVFIAKTMNGGSSWTTLYSEYAEIAYSNRMLDVFFPSLDTGFIIGKNGATIYRTFNSGNNWSETIVAGTLSDLSFISAKTGWACASGGYIFKTINSGDNWYNTTTPTSNYLSTIYFVNALTGWAAGGNGIIIKTTNGGFTFIQPISNEIPIQFSLSQNYPNPFNPTTNIQFSIINVQYVTLKIFDLLGREVATLVNEQLQPGTYEVDFDGSGFASGVYYYKLTASDYTETKKMILMK